MQLRTFPTASLTRPLLPSLSGAVCCSFFPGPELPCLCALLNADPSAHHVFPALLPFAFPSARGVLPCPSPGVCSFPSGTGQRCLSAASQPFDFFHSLGCEAIELSLAFVFKFRLNGITLGKLLFVPGVSPP